ncbi:MAG TPA: hypothetical protein VNA25_17255 [Phycisphaerae bacterium]|nr:hypothetical protein [Phycisphaerae bacterium]
MSDHWVPKALEDMQHCLAENGEIHLVTQNYQQIRSVRQLAQAIPRGKI